MDDVRLTPEEAVRLAMVEAAFEEAGGRGVELAEEIDALRRKRDGVPDPEVRSYLSDLIDTNDDGQEVAFGYDPDVRERAIAWLQSFDQR